MKQSVKTGCCSTDNFGSHQMLPIHLCGQIPPNYTFRWRSAGLRPPQPNAWLIGPTWFHTLNCIPFIWPVFTYASAVLAMGLCLSVCLSVTSRCSIETDERIELLLCVCELPSTRPTLCKNEIRLSPKIRALSSGTLS